MKASSGDRPAFKSEFCPLQAALGLSLYICKMGLIIKPTVEGLAEGCVASDCGEHVGKRLAHAKC